MPGAADHPYDRIIIGAGTTAAVYLSFFPPGDGEKVGVIGAPEPWSARGQHRMGQTSNLLMLPLVEPERPLGFEPHTRATPQPSRDRPPQDPFLRSDVYARQIRLERGLRGKGAFSGQGFGPTKFRHAWVRSVTWMGDKFKVSYQYGDDNGGVRKHHFAKQVIVATGPGPAMHSNTVYGIGPPAGVYYRGDEYLDNNVHLRGRVVAVEGGSATAAWCVEKALLEGANQVFWFTRPDARAPTPQLQYSMEKRFGAAFPAGDRNVWLKQEGRVVRMVAALSGATWTNQTSGGQNRLRLTFAEGQEFFVDQYAAAVGASETAEFLGALRSDSEMDPIVDTAGHLHPSGAAILGYIGKTKPFLIVGAGVFKVTKGREHPKGVFERTKPEPERYSRGNEYLPTAARPPEGIPTIIATIATLTRYLYGGSSRWLDINLGNFSDLDDHFSMGVARSFARVVLEQVDGYSLDQVARFITDQVIGTRIMRSSPYGIKVEELAELKRQLEVGYYGRGTYLQSLVDAYYS